MKKKIMAAILGITMTASLFAGCAGKQEEAAAPAEVKEEPAESVKEEPAEEEVKEEKEEELVKEEPAEEKEEEKADETKEADSGNIRLHTVKEFASRVDDDGKALVMGHYPVISIEGGNEAITKAMEDLSKEIKDDVEKNMDEYKEFALEDMQEREEMPDSYYSYECDATVTKAADDVISLMLMYYSFSGGAHPSTWYVSHTYSTGTGEELNAANVVNDIDALPKLLEEKLLAEYDKEIFFEEDVAGAVKETYETNGDYTYTLDNTGITFYFSAYELAPYAAGAQIVSIKYSDEPDLVKAEYSKESDAYIEGMLMDRKYDITDGSVLSMSWYPGMEDEYEYELNVDIDGKESSEKIECTGMQPYLVKTGDAYYLYLQENQLNDYVIIDVYSFDGGKIKKVGTVDRGFKDDSVTNPSDMELAGRTDLLSTNNVYRSYHVGDDGMPVANDEYDLVIPSVAEKLTLKQDIKTDVFVTEDSKESAEVTIQKGTELTFFRTDNETFMDMKDEDDRVVRFYVKTGDWPQKVNDMDIEELFDGCVFAG